MREIWEWYLERKKGMKREKEGDEGRIRLKEQERKK